MKARENVILKKFLPNATAAIIIRAPRFLISKDILQRYDSPFYIRNIQILPIIDEKIFYFFFNNSVVVIFLDELDSV
jgi:hypothetical protein